MELLENGEMHFSNKAPKLQAVQVEKLFYCFFTVEDARISTGAWSFYCQSPDRRNGREYPGRVQGGNADDFPCLLRHYFSCYPLEAIKILWGESLSLFLKNREK